MASSDYTRGLVTLAVAGAFILLAFGGILGRVFSDSGSRPLHATIADAKQLQKGDEVRVHGVDVGQVDDIRLNSGARSATIDMGLKHNVGSIYRDASITVRWKTLLGGAFYVDLDPGTAHAGRLGNAAIPERNSHSQVELEDVTSVVRGDAQRGLQTLPGQTALALQDPNGLNNLLDALGDVAPSVQNGLGALRGVNPDQDLSTLLATSADTVSALGEDPAALREVVQGVASFVDVTGRRHAELDSSLRQLPGVMRNVNGTLVRLAPTLDRADRLMTTLRRPAADVGPTLEHLHPVVTEADTLLDNARPLLAALSPAAESLQSAARVGPPVLDALRPSLRRLDNNILPNLNKVDPTTGRTVAEMVGPGLNGIGAPAAHRDGNGAYVRFPASGGQTPLLLPCQEYFSDPHAPALIKCQSLQQSLDQVFGGGGHG